MSAAHELPDPYAYWRNALVGTFGPIHDSDCQAGFWRKRASRGGPFLPVATWIQNGRMVAIVDGKETDPAELWTYICRYPITEEQYHNRVQTGTWHDMDSAVDESLAPPPIGHNAPPQDDADILAAQIAAASANAKAYETITDDTTAAKAQSARARLNELSRDADKRREALKRPHLEAGKAIDTRWNPLVKAAKAAADAIARALSAHETRKAREAAEVARNAEEERQRDLAAELAQNPQAPPEFVAQHAPKAEPAPAPVTTIRGAYGRAAAVKAVKVARVTNYELAVPFFANDQGVRALVDKLAQRAVDADITPPGVEVTEERKVI